MKTTEFCYWLQGLFELSNPQSLNAVQTELIKRHLALVFQHDIDPSYPKEQQAVLNQIHSGVDGQTGAASGIHQGNQSGLNLAKEGRNNDLSDVRYRC